MEDHNEVLAQENFSWLKNNTYPGRGIVAGLNESTGYLVQVYWIMGRKPNSRNRVFISNKDTGRLYTEAADATKMDDPSFVIYNAMRENGCYFIVSNGDQTDTVANFQGRFHLDEILARRVYEPDPPTYTQRITAVSSPRSVIQMSILRKSRFGGQCDRLMFQYNPYPGFGHCITTYEKDGEPPPPFRGDPLIMPIRGNIEKIAKCYWDALNKDNRVSLAVKFIDQFVHTSEIHIINKYQKVS